MKTTLYHRASGGGVKVWSIWIEHGSTLVTSWGLHGGTMQSTKDPKRSKGKEGTKAFKTPDLVAAEDRDRKIKSKKDEGYVENIDDVLGTVQAGLGAAPAVHQMQTEHGKDMARFTSSQRAGFDFNNPPKAFAPAKPHNDYRPDLAQLKALDSKGDLFCQRKGNGGRHFAFIGDQRVTIWTRRMENATGQFPDLVQSLTETRDQYPGLTGTVLDMEFMVLKDGKDCFPLVGSVCRSDDRRSVDVQLQLIKSKHDVHFMAFDVLYMSGEAIFSQPYRQRLDLLEAIVEKVASPRLRVVETLKMPFDVAQALARSQGWEGLVAWDATRGSMVQLNGKPKRANAWKVKDEYEDDFICLRYEYGDGKFSSLVGAIHIGQFNEAGTKIVERGKCGGGFTDFLRDEALSWRYRDVIEDGSKADVIQVRYNDVTADGKLIFPRLVRRRTDKPSTECIYVPEE